MSTISVELADELEVKAQELATEEGVSLDQYINAMITASLKQQQTIAFFGQRLRDVDASDRRARVMAFMNDTRPGTEPSPEEIERAIH